MRAPGEIVLVSCYELGRPPAQLAAAVTALRRAGFAPGVLDLGVEPFDAAAQERLRAASLVAVATPMHTALRLGIALARRLRRERPGLPLVFCGLYATLHAAALREEFGATALGGEWEPALVTLVESVGAGAAATWVPSAPVVERVEMHQPARDALPALARYTRLVVNGEHRVAGAVEASRGCRHLCRHCPVPAVYGGRFFVVPAEIVLRDVATQVEGGARHISFADADFLNGPRHALEIARALHAAHPEVTFDFTSKVEHLLKHRDQLPELAASGCLFVVTAVESLSEDVLRRLEKGHTGAQATDAMRLLKAAGIQPRPSLLPFTPWSTLAGFGALLAWAIEEDLVMNIDPVQWAIRLLLPPGSLLLGEPSLAAVLRGFDTDALAWTWEHPDPRMDALAATVHRIVEDAEATGESHEATFERVLRAADAAWSRRGEVRPVPEWVSAVPLRTPPRMTESWFC